MDIQEYEKKMWLKCRLLVEGCNILPTLQIPSFVQTKEIHLYSHSQEKASFDIPDDVLLGDSGSNALICRIRYHSQSPLMLMQKEEKYFIFDTEKEIYYPIRLIPKPGFCNEKIEETLISEVCGYLGLDLVGAVPSNSCFYFKNKMQCKFCEILPTYENHVKYPKPLKNLSTICDALQRSIEKEKKIQHICITAGNVKSYDYTCRFFIDIGKELLKRNLHTTIKHVLATLMPPNQLSLIDELSNTFFNKVSFPLEVYEKDHFKITCPGKAAYGYDNILQALQYALKFFGKGNVLTNLVYGMQSFHPEQTRFFPEKENEFALIATQELLKREILPTFSIYHYGGFNSVGKLELDSRYVYNFFKEWGKLVVDSHLLPQKENTLIFSPWTCSNTLYNDAFLLAKETSKATSQNIDHHLQEMNFEK